MLAALLLVSGWPAGHAAVNAVVSPPAPYIPVYNLTDLGTAVGDSQAVAFGINANGDVSGWTAGTHQRAFRYSGTTMTALDQINTVNTSFEDIGFAINASGEVAGFEGQIAAYSNFTGDHLDGHDRNEHRPRRGCDRRVAQRQR